MPISLLRKNSKWTPAIATIAIVGGCLGAVLVGVWVLRPSTPERNEARFRDAYAEALQAAKQEREAREQREYEKKLADGASSALEAFRGDLAHANAYPRVVTDLAVSDAAPEYLTMVVISRFASEPRTAQLEFGRTMLQAWRQRLLEHSGAKHGGLYLHTQSGTLIGQSHGNDFELEPAP